MECKLKSYSLVISFSWLSHKIPAVRLMSPHALLLLPSTIRVNPAGHVLLLSSSHSPTHRLSACMADLVLFLPLSRHTPGQAQAIDTRKRPAGEHCQLLLRILAALATATTSVKLIPHTQNEQSGIHKDTVCANTVNKETKRVSSQLRD